MDSQKIPILLNLIAALFGALGQYAYKKGGQRLTEVSLWMNYQLILGILLFCGVMACFVFSYKLGGRISVVYPFYATTFIWGSVIGFVFEGEKFSWISILGVAFIVLGLVTIVKGATT